jgi:hypothetical protein
MHFCPHAVPNDPTWNEAQQSGSSHSGHPTDATPANSLFDISPSAPMQPQLENFPSHTLSSVSKNLKHSTSRRRRIGGPCNSSLKLALQNSYARISKKTGNSSLLKSNPVSVTICHLFQTNLLIQKTIV